MRTSFGSLSPLFGISSILFTTKSGGSNSVNPSFRRPSQSIFFFFQSVFHVDFSFLVTLSPVPLWAVFLFYMDGVRLTSGRDGTVFFIVVQVAISVDARILVLRHVIPFLLLCCTCYSH